MKFSKYQGAGNDFIILNDLNHSHSNITPKQIAALCDRRFGIGADGLLLLQPANELAFRMKYYNSDGSLASFCGNGARCICAFALATGLVETGRPFEFVADDGRHRAVCTSADHIDLQMIDVERIERIDNNIFAMNTGVPHYVEIVPSEQALDAISIVERARPIRFGERFAPQGTNVNFVAVSDIQHISIRTYERGVEDETLACGTGITAGAIAAGIISGAREFDVDARGGRLKVRFETDGTMARNVHLGGPAVRVFDGEI